MLTSYSNYSKISNALRGPSRIHIVLGAVFLPWLVTVFGTAGIWAAFNLLGYALAVFLAGYGLLSLAVPGSARTEAIVFAPALGIVAFSGLSALWLRLGLPLVWVSALWLAAAFAGGCSLWRDRAQWAKGRVVHGAILSLLSALICLVYFLPAARNDAVPRPDGSFNWIYVDTQWFYSMAMGIKNGGSPPTAPGAATEQLFYHFGPYAPAATISRLTGLDLGDALARVTHGVSLWALVLSCFGLGTLLSLKATSARFGGIMAVAGLFFYGSLLSLFTNEVNSSSHVTGAILFTIPGVEVLGQGGPFSHLILGHSELHGLIAITSILGLCIMQRERGVALTWQRAILLALPALAVPVNSVAALYSLCATGILLFWGHCRAVRSWLWILVMFCLFFAAWKVMGYGHAADATLATINRNPGSAWWGLAVEFLIGLGFRIVGFRWISRPFTDPLSAFVLASVLGLVSFTLLLQFQYGQQRYGLYFLQSVFSILAFSRLAPGCWRAAERSQWIAEWLRLAKKGAVCVAVCGLLIGSATFVTHCYSGTPHLYLKILLSCLTAALLAGTSVLMKKSRYSSAAGSIVLAGILLIGFLAWITPWLNFGMGRMKMDVTIPSAEVRGLNRLRELAGPGERFATNKHIVDSLVTLRERSYAYSTLSERPVLLEGYSYLEGYSRSEGPSRPRVANVLLRDNDLMFSTTDPITLREIAKSHHVRWLVARPGTDISIPQPLPRWLVREQDSGDLKIYQVN
jgi:hypothetical protein